MLRRREVEQLAQYLGLWGAWGVRVVSDGRYWEVEAGEGLPREGDRVLQLVHEHYRFPLMELTLLAGGTLEPEALRLLSYAGQHKGWLGMVEAAKAIGTLRKYHPHPREDIWRVLGNPVA